MLPDSYLIFPSTLSSTCAPGSLNSSFTSTSITLSPSNVIKGDSTPIIIPINPATNVLFRLDSPNDASTVRDDISSNSVGRAPEILYDFEGDWTGE